MNTLPYAQTIESRNRVRNMLVPQRNLWALELIQTATARMGQNRFDKDDPRLQQAVKDFIDIILPTVSQLSQQEVEHVMALGACGELGDGVGISSRTIAGWFRVYMADVRPKIAAKYREETEVPVRELPPAEFGREYFEAEAKKAAYEYEPADTELIHPRMFDIYVEHGLIAEPEKKLAKHRERAQMEARKEARKEKMEEALAVRSIIGVWAKKRGQKEDGRVTAWCKRLAVAEYYDWLRVRG